ncbi:MAG: ABC transporter permease subunit [Haloarculaceae archaeon]
MSADVHETGGSESGAGGSDAGTSATDDRAERPLLAVARFEGRNRLRITGVIAAVFVLYGLIYVWLGPELVVGSAITDLVEALPPVLRQLLGFESFASVEGLLASEFYTFGWMVGLGGYLAYSAATTVSGDLRDGRMDTLLAAPAARSGVLLGKFLALLVPIALLSVVVPVGLYVAAVAVGTPLSLADLLVLHALSIPYLLVWSGAGLLLGAVVRRGRTAGRVALGLVFFGWLFESVVGVTDYAWTGAVSPMRYFDPPAILNHGEYDLVGAGVLLVAAVALVAISLVWFGRHDL